MEEPTVLDAVKSLLRDWRKLPDLLKQIAQTRSAKPPLSADLSTAPQEVSTTTPVSETQAREAGLKTDTLDHSAQQKIPLPAPPAEAVAQPLATPQRLSRAERLSLLSSLSALIVALFAQASLEPPHPNATLGAVLYAMAAALLIFSSFKSLLSLPPLSDTTAEECNFRLHLPAFGAALVSAILAFLTFGGGQFNTLNLLLWGVAIYLTVRAFYPLSILPFNGLRAALVAWQKGEWQVRITRWTLLMFATALILLFFRFYRLAEVPPEMVSDHAEKLLDVADVLDGQWHIFFPRNTGREAFQMFLTAAMATLFGTGLSFLSLKLGTAIAGLVTLPYLYLLGKEIANRRVGWIAMTLAGVSYWLNVITRVGLRFSLYPLFVAPTLYYLIRALRRPNATDFILCGLFLGLGLHGYSPFRIVPLVVLIAIALALLHRATPQRRRDLLIGLMIVGIVSVIVFLPLLRYTLENPEMFFYRSLTRFTDLEKPLDRPAVEIFFNNLWKAMIMTFWNNGGVWVVSIPGRPALSVVSAALFFIGSLLVLFRYLRRFEWVDLFLLVSIPLLMLPSILSLAFPDENPILNRTAGAIIPVFILAALGLETLIRPFESAFRSGWRHSMGWLIAFALLALSMIQDYDLVFRQYQTLYAQSAWNTSQMGKVIQTFASTIGTADTAWVIAYPHWVDTRLVGINAGFPRKDYAIWPDQLTETLVFEGPKLFIVKPEDSAGLEALQQLYPSGSWQLQRSPYEGKDFYLYFVPPADLILPEAIHPEP